MWCGAGLLDSIGLGNGLTVRTGVGGGRPAATSTSASTTFRCRRRGLLGAGRRRDLGRSGRDRSDPTVFIDDRWGGSRGFREGLLLLGGCWGPVRTGGGEGGGEGGGDSSTLECLES